MSVNDHTPLLSTKPCSTSPSSSFSDDHVALLSKPSSSSASPSPSASPSRPSRSTVSHTMSFEEHRPGKLTTYKTLSPVSSSIDVHEPKRSSFIKSQSYSHNLTLSHVHSYHAHNDTNNKTDTSTSNTHSASTSTNATPLQTYSSFDKSMPIPTYKYGDGTIGYTIKLPPRNNSDTNHTANNQASERDELLQNQRIQTHVNIAIWASLIVNIILFVSKTYAVLVTKSLSVAASAVDSFLDLLSQLIVAWAEKGTKNVDSTLYPAGRARLEPVGIILCASIMGMAALQLIVESITQLYTGFTDNKHFASPLVFDTITIYMLLSTILSKIILWLYCRLWSSLSPTVMTLAVDHRNDVYSNIVAAIAAVLALYDDRLWYADPIGAILMSMYIALNWYGIGTEQIEQLVGKSASPDFIDDIKMLSTNFHPMLVPDIIRAYHFGARFLVELEVILPADMSVREAHDISLALQQSIEQLNDVERAFVHVDFKQRDIDEHDWEQIGKMLRNNQNHEQTAA